MNILFFTLFSQNYVSSPPDHGRVVLAQVPEENPQLGLDWSGDPGVAASEQSTGARPGGEPIPAGQPLHQGDKMGLKVFPAQNGLGISSGRKGW